MSSEPDASEQVRRSIELLWGGAVRPGRGPKPSLTLDGIVQVAIALADRDGIDGLSMRRVAAELGVGTMSLYRYVPGKAELLALMLDKVSDPHDDLARYAGDDWRGVLDKAVRGSYALHLAHPWLLEVNWARPVIGPNTLAGIELFMRALDGLGLTDQERMSVVMLVDAFAVGQARQRIQYEAVVAESGISDEEFWGRQGPFLEKAMLSGRYPAMAALGADAFDASWDEAFDFGLERLLDGVASLVASRSARGRGAARPRRPRRPDAD